MNFNELQQQASKIMQRYAMSDVVMLYDETKARAFFQEHKHIFQAINTRLEFTQEINNKVGYWGMTIESFLYSEDIDKLYQLFLQTRGYMEA
jgi:hypothetical protein